MKSQRLIALFDGFYFFDRALIGGGKFIKSVFNLIKIMWLMGGMLVSYSSLSLASQAIQFSSVKETFQNQQLALNAVADFKLSKAIMSAIHHEIHIFFKTEILLLEEGRVLGTQVDRVRQSIEYHTELYASGVNRRYVLHNHRNHKLQTFQTLEAALQTLGTLQALPIIDLSELHSGKTYRFKVRLFLDKWKLPAPLLIDALFEPYWQLDSGWVEREIKMPKNRM